MEEAAPTVSATSPLGSDIKEQSLLLMPDKMPKILSRSASDTRWRVMLKEKEDVG